jgi:23S rRNA pseudouridine2605 synthase
MNGRIRLQKLLARAGVASRRGAEGLISAGRVRVNGNVVTVLGTTVDPANDDVRVDGRKVRIAEPVWIVVNKPTGYVTTRRDPQGRPTVYDLLPRGMGRLFHVGRLDAASEGLLLLTNDGDTAHRLLHPRYEVERVYEVEVDGIVSAAARERLLTGVMLEDGTARAHAVRRITPALRGRDRLRMTLREGRNREVRRMLEAVGHEVRRLRRVRYGPVQLAKLASGAWRPLTAAERDALAAHIQSTD